MSHYSIPFTSAALLTAFSAHPTVPDLEFLDPPVDVELSAGASAKKSIFPTARSFPLDRGPGPFGLGNFLVLATRGLTGRRSPVPLAKL